MKAQLIVVWFKKFCLRCKNLNDQASPSRSKIVDFKVVLQSRKVNPVSRNQRVSGEPGISYSSVVRHFYELDKNIQR